VAFSCICPRIGISGLCELRRIRCGLVSRWRDWYILSAVSVREPAFPTCGVFCLVKKIGTSGFGISPNWLFSFGLEI